MKKLLIKYLAPFALALVLISSFQLAFASAASAAPGLSVTGALVDITLSPGQNYTHTMTITNNAGDPLDITVEARGFGQTTDGSNIELTAENDASPYSARQYITQIDNPSFHLEPGASGVVNATIQLPQDIGSGTRYALIYIHSLPTGAGSVGFIMAADVPVILTVPGSTLQTTGTITDLTVPQPASGQPLNILTIFQNTGNYHYKVRNQVTITDASGTTVGTGVTTLTVSSIVPTYSRLFSITPILTDPANGLPPGTYTAKSQILLNDNTVIATKTVSFSIGENYQRLPGICSGSIVVTTFRNEVPYVINAMAQADTEVEWRDTGNVTGTVIIGKYCALPNASVAFSDTIANGGTGKPAVKYVYVHVDGFTQGTAHITVAFNSTEVSDFDVNSLFLGYFDGSVWRKFSNIQVYSGAGTITGDIPVSALSGTAIGVGGDLQTYKAHEGTTTTSSGGLSWPVAGGAIAGALILGLIIAFLFTRRRKTAKQ